MCMTSRETERSMVSILETCWGPATWTPPLLPSMKSEAWKKRARKSWTLMISTQSLPRSSSPRTPVASMTSLKSWSCTTKTKTEPFLETNFSDCWPILVSFEKSYTNTISSAWKNNDKTKFQIVGFHQIHWFQVRSWPRKKPRV